MMFKTDVRGLCIAGILFVSTTGCGDSNADTSPAKDKEKQNTAMPVRVQELQPRHFVESLHLSGTLKAHDDILLSPEEGGVVKEWKYARGEFLPRGAVVVTLNDDLLKPGYEAALAQYRSAQLTFEKQQKVYEEQGVSEWQLTTTAFARDAAKAQAELMQARWERTRMKSPVSGILDDRFIDAGEMAPPGVPIARIVNIKQIKVLGNVPEKYAGSVAVGTPIRVTVFAYPGHVFTGNISFVSTAISPDNRTFTVEALLANPHLILKPEMIAKVSIALAEKKNALLIEEAVVQQVDRNKLVVYVEENGKALERVVHLGGRQGNLVEVVDGLRAGERIIVHGQQQIVHEQPVVVVK